jgi:2-keto-3-deoxy-L-rhamnonate aldolase RhmA
MAIVENHLKNKLLAGELAIGMGVVHLRGMNTAGIAEACGFDWLFIDMEHNAMSIDTATQMSVAALPTNVTPLVRIPGHEHYHASRALDGGAMGIVAPHVDTPEQARAIVNACKFPPLGHRSLTAPAPQLGFAPKSVAEAIEILNANTLVVIMLESPEAIDNADAIAAIEGVDALLIGTNDLCAEMGIPGQFGHEKVLAAFERMIEATTKHGISAGMGGIYDQVLTEKIVQMGVRLLLAGSDASFLMTAAKARSDFLATIDI